MFFLRNLNLIVFISNVFYATETMENINRLEHL